ncbi:TRAP transporter large permease subunit, partial [Paracoccaceae bacterium]|nr:TRAP transporter large permease subunit [Paracoccaceae bacterium]
MELFFLLILILIMATALGSGYPVAFALPGSAIITIVIAAISGYAFEGDVSSYFHSGGPSEWISAGVLNLRGVYWEVERDTLIAIPLFIFMGIMLQRSKIAEDLLVTMARLFGPVRGGLGISVVFVGALLAATTGIVGATVVAMGLISLPAMLRNKYSPSLATGTIAASGTLGQIIPPSIVLIILADQLASAADQAGSLRKSLFKESTGNLQMPSVFDVTSTSAGEMFLGAFIPGLVLVALYMLYILGYAFLKPSAAPSVPYEGKFDRAFWGQVFITLVPPLTLIFLVLGSIIAGIATVNQAGAIGAAGALVMAGYRLVDQNKWTFVPAFLVILGLLITGYALQNYEMNIKAAESAEDMQGIWIGVLGALVMLTGIIWSAMRVLNINGTLHGVMMETAKTTALVFVILLGAAMLTAAFRAFGGEDLVREFLNSLPGGFWTQFVIVMAVIFVLGFFLDFIEIAVVVVPIVAPILLADPGANITAVWLGVMIGLNIQTSFLTPPFGFALFYLRGVAPAVVRTIEMYRGVIPFILLQLLALGIVGNYPQLVNYLPNRSNLLSESAPPPRNPRLQFCMDQFVGDQIAASGGATVAAIEKAKRIDLSNLSDILADPIANSLKEADKALENLAQISVTAAAVKASEDSYRPMLSQVRSVQKQLRQENEHLKASEKELARLKGEEFAQRRAALTTDVADTKAKIATLEGEIPASWETEYETFSLLTAAETKARNTYRRAADGTFEGASEALMVLEATSAYISLEAELIGLRSIIEAVELDADYKSAEEAVKQAERSVRAVEGADDVKKALGKAKKALGKRKKDREKALAHYEETLELYAAQLEWRAQAEAELRGPLSEYVEALKGTL